MESKIEAPQEQNRSAEEFSKRTDLLARKLEIPLRELPPRIHLSTSMFFGYRGGKNRITNKAWGKLRSAEIEAGISTQAVEEERPPFVVSPRDMRINPRFALPPASPTRGDVEAYVAAYLDLCSQLPGGWGFAYNEVLSSLPMEKVKRLLEHQSSSEKSI